MNNQHYHMLKLLHTADWHLGQTFFEYERRGEHRAFLAWLSEQVRANEVDLLLIAEDVFDTQNPSAEAPSNKYNLETIYSAS